MSKERGYIVVALLITSLIPDACAPLPVDSCPQVPLVELGEIEYLSVSLEDLSASPDCYRGHNIVLDAVEVTYMNTHYFPEFNPSTRGPLEEETFIEVDNYRVGSGETAVTFSLQDSELLNDGRYTIYAWYNHPTNKESGSLYVSGFVQLDK